MGDQDDLPLDQHEEVQTRKTAKEPTNGDQLEEVIEEIRELMLKSTEEVVSRRRLNRGEPTAVAGKQTTTTKQRSRWTTPERSLGSRRISTVERRSS
jgi:hypothetical protein